MESKTITLRIPVDLYEIIKSRAVSDKRSINSQILYSLALYFLGVETAKNGSLPFSSEIKKH